MATQTPFPNLILLDIIMPDMDGYAVIKQLKYNPLTQEILVIFITAKAKETDEIKGLQLGAFDYIYKPLKIGVIKLRINHLLKLQHAKFVLEERERFYRGMTEAMADGLFIHDKKGICLFVNPKAEQLLGWTSNEIIGKSFYEIAYYQGSCQNSFSIEECFIFQSLVQGKTYQSEKEEFICKDGSVFPVSMSAVRAWKIY